MDVKKIRFERTGGFAGIRLTAKVDMTDLPDPERTQLAKLIDDMDFDELPENLRGEQNIPDGFVYSITVEGDDDEHTVIAGETSVSDEMEGLIEILERIAKKQARDR